MSRLEQVADAIAFAVERVLAVALIAGITLNFINVVGRYLSGFTLIGVDEIEIYILIWIAFLGAAVVTWRGQHLRMDVLLNACPAIVRSIVAVAEMCVMLAVALFVAYHSFRYVERIYALGAVSDIARVPTWFPHSAVFISFAVITLIAVIRMAQGLRRQDAAAEHDLPAESEPRP
jgi:TRAP-type C4-dicarboxylate transport system permease small subunit